MSAYDKQVGGNHYKGAAIQPVTFITANGLGFCAGNVIKYVFRADKKHEDPIEDLEKAKHYIELLIEETKRAGTRPAQREVPATSRYEQFGLTEDV